MDLKQIISQITTFLLDVIYFDTIMSEHELKQSIHELLIHAVGQNHRYPTVTGLRQIIF